MTPLGDARRVGERVGILAEAFPHLLRRLQVELVGPVLQPMRVVDRLAGADAQQDVVRLVIAVAQVVDVVGDHHREIELPRQRRQAVVDDLLLAQPLVLHLEEEVALAEDFRVLPGRRPRLLDLVLVDALGDLALQAAAEADQAGAVRLQQFLVDAGLVVEALRVAGGHQLDQVVVALVGLGEQHQVVLRLAGHTAAVAAVTGRDVHLAAEDRPHAVLLRRVVEHDRREHVAVLGDGERRHAEPRRFLHQLVDAAGAVEQRILGVQVEVDEVLHARATPTRWCLVVCC